MDINNDAPKRGRKKKNSGKETQHSVYVDPDLWEAADHLPTPRPDIIREALLNAVSFYESDLPKLKWQHEELIKQIQALQAQDAVILSRIEHLEAKVLFDTNEQDKEDARINSAINETLRMCKTFKKSMGYPQYSLLSELSGVEPAEIEVFLVDSKYKPSEDAVREFYQR